MKWKNLSPTVFAKALALLAALTFSAASQAVPITFSFTQDYDENLDSVFLESGGISLTANGFSPSGLSLADEDGLCFAGWGEQFRYCKNLIESLNLTFSESVRLISYEVGYFRGDRPDDPNDPLPQSSAVLSFNQGANTAIATKFSANEVNPFLDPNTLLPFVDPFVVIGGEPLSVLASNLPDEFGSIQVREITVELVRNDIPIPAPFILIVLGLAALHYSVKRRAKTLG